MPSRPSRLQRLTLPLLILLALAACLLWPDAPALLAQTPPPAATPGAVEGQAAAPRAVVRGRAILEGRSRFNGVYATLDRGDGGFDETDAAGVFEIGNIALGWHILRLDMPGYLAVEGSFLASDATTVLGDLLMLGGDAYGDNVIDLFDLSLVARWYDTSPPGDARADINANNTVDLFDLVLVTKNYDRQGPTDGQNAAVRALPASLSAARRERSTAAAARAPSAGDPTATWQFDTGRSPVRVGDVVTATLSLDKAASVYGAEVRQTYPTPILRARTPTVGSLFPAAFAATQRVDGAAIRLDVTQFGNTPRPASGSLVQVVFEVAGCGDVSLDPTGALRLTDGRGGLIPFQPGPPATLKVACP